MNILKIYFKQKNLIKNPTIENVQEDISHYNEYCHQLERNFSYDEMGIAILNTGRGIGMDGLDKNIARLFPKGLRDDLTQFCNTVFRLSYPKYWTYQILRPEVKKWDTL